MAKYYNNQKKTGKVAGSVFAIRSGVTIERAYNPVVANPNTPAQVQARAKMKLLSQMSAIMGSIIAIPRQGIVSTRNLFVRANYPAMGYTNNEATIDLAAVKLTTGVLALPNVVATRDGNAIDVALSNATAGFSRIVYVAFVHAGNEIRLWESRVVSEPGVQSTYSTALSSTSYPLTVYAYGVRDNSENARVTFSNMSVPTAEEVAKVIVSRVLLETDVTLSETKSASVAAS